MRRCSDCRFRDVEHVDDGAVVIECHARPPQCVWTGDEMVRLFPQVDADDWCGLFEPEQ